MILDKILEVRSNGRNDEHYLELGYKKDENGYYHVKSEDLPPHSGIQETRICDLCGKEFTRRHEHHVVTNKRYEGMDICGECYKNSDFTYHHKVEKARKVFMERYGCYPAASPQGKEAMRKAFEKFEGGHPMKDKKIREKVSKTFNERYGGNSPQCDPKVREKTQATLLKMGIVPTSSQQIKIFNLVKEIYPDAEECELNHVLSTLALDIYLLIDGLKIDIEYDGKHWHENRKKEDRRRDEYVKSQGYKILRIRSKHKIPKKRDIKEKIEYLKKSKRSFTSITMDDWETKQETKSER